MNRGRNLAPIFAYFVGQIVIAQDLGLQEAARLRK
jgi:hypothetical protein